MKTTFIAALIVLVLGMCGTSASFAQSDPAPPPIQPMTDTCPSITRILIDACFSPQEDEGKHEMIFLNTGTYALPIQNNTWTVSYSTNGSSYRTYTDCFTRDSLFVVALNNVNNPFTYFLEAIPGDTLPPGADLLLLSDSIVATYDSSALFCPYDTLYVLFSCDVSWQSTGNFLNQSGVSCSGSPELRYFQVNFIGITGDSSCNFHYSYDACSLLGLDGSFVDYEYGDSVLPQYGLDICSPKILAFPDPPIPAGIISTPAPVIAFQQDPNSETLIVFPGESPFSFQLYTIQGVCVLKESSYIQTDEPASPLQISGLAAGLYFYRGRVGTEAVSGKIRWNP